MEKYFNFTITSKIQWSIDDYKKSKNNIHEK